MTKEYTKITDIGEIPEEWSVEILENSTDLFARIGWQGLTTNEYRSDGEHFLVTGTDFEKGYVDWDNCVFVDKFRYDQDQKIQLKNDDILLTKDGTIGKVAFVRGLKKPATLNSGVFVLRPKGNSYDPKFFYFLLNSFYFKDFLNRINAGSTIKHLYQKDFVKFKFPLPQIEEQKKIAEALSDCDYWIESIEKLIEKKKLIKQGAIQKLLEPKENWERKTLGDILDYIQPINFLVQSTEYDDNHLIPVLTAGKTFILGYTNEEFGIFKNLPTIIFDDFTTASKYVDFPFKAKSSAMKMLVTKSTETSLKFVYELMQLIKFPLGDHKRHWIGEYQKVEIQMPDFQEQKRIAKILSDIGDEIDILIIKLQKAKQVKQGMMQDLLTGKVRLV